MREEIHILEKGVPEDLEQMNFSENEGREKKIYFTNYGGILLSKLKNVDSFLDHIQKIRSTKANFPITIPFTDLQSKETIVAIQNFGDTFESKRIDKIFPEFKIKQLTQLIINLLELEYDGNLPFDLYPYNVTYEPSVGFRVIDFDYYTLEDKSIVGIYGWIEYVLTVQLFRIRDNKYNIIKTPAEIQDKINKILIQITKNHKIYIICNKDYRLVTDEEKECLKLSLKEID